MKKKILGIYVCMLLVVVTALPAIGVINDDKNIRATSDNYCNLAEQAIGRSSVSSDWLEKKLLASDGASQDQFGFSVSIDGDYVIVGAPLHSIEKGKAYIFKRSGSTWTDEQKLTVPDGEHYDYFGGSVSIDGNYAIVGASGSDANGYNYGSAYIFKRIGATWTEEQNLFASDGATDDNFGYSVSIDGDYAIVGAFCDDGRTGSAYIFKRSGSTWTDEQKLTASDGSENDRFGWSVSIDGDYVIAGAYKDDSGTGSAYVFKRNGTSWTEEQKLTASDGATWDQFGYSVSIDGNYAISGANCDDDHGGMSGSAYVFKRNGTSWTEEQKLTASDGAESDFFGMSVSIDGNYAISGANGDDGFTGSAYVFKRNGTSWTKKQKLTASDGGTAEEFGWSVSINGNNAIIGAHTDDDNGGNSGSAYVFMKDDGTHSPDEPSIDGPASGIVGTEYEYTFNTVDPNGDDVYYYIEWGDDDFEDWIGPYSSGDDVKVNHTWHKRGTYMIRAKAKDPYDYESGWGYLDVTMPVNQQSSRSNPIPSQKHSSQQSTFPLFFQILQGILNNI